MADLPPGPRTPALLQTLQWIRDPVGLMDRCHRAYGSPFTLRLVGMGPMVFVIDPTVVKALYTADASHLRAGQANGAVLQAVLGPSSLLILDEQPHRRQRRLLMPPFHGRRMRAYGDIVQSAARRASDTWVVGTEVTVQDAARTLSLEVILRAVFGVDEGERLEAFEEAVGATLDSLHPSLLFLRFLRLDLGRFSAWGRYRLRQRRFDALIQGEIDRRRAETGEPGEDILSLLVAATHEDGSPMSDDELRDQLSTLLVAGHETTATGLAWAVRWVLRDPEVLAKLRAELDELDDDTPPDEIAKLPYLDAVGKEALRLVPVVPITARLVYEHPFDVGGGYQAGVGHTVAPCIHLAHRRPAAFEEPERFRPERFLERSYSPFEYMPFGGGARRCIGAALARYELNLALAAILRRFDLELVNPERTAGARRNVTVSPDDETRIRILGLR